MKHNNKTRKRLITAISVLSAVLALLLGVVIYLNVNSEVQKMPGESTAQTNPDDTASAPESEATGSAGTVIPVDDVVISTEFCDLYFPGEWADMVKAQYVESDEGGVVIFTGTVNDKKAELFTIVFSSSAEAEGSPVGVLDRNGEYVLICARMNDPEFDTSWTDEERDAMTAMCESVNYLIEMLEHNPAFSHDTGVMSPEQKLEFMEIATPFVTLRYPGQWADQVWTEYTQADNGGFVTFYGAVGGEDVTLFVIHFANEEEGAVPVGYVKVNGEYVAVSVVMPEQENSENWTAADQDTYDSMREGLNDVLKALQSSGSYSAQIVAESEETTAPQEDVTAATPYADLQIPAQWKDQVHTETEELTGGYAVKFIGTVGGHEEVLFTVFFGTETENSFPVGVLKVDGEEVSVSVEMKEIETDNTWTAEEADAITAMQESINDVLGNLAEDPDFSAQ